MGLLPDQFYEMEIEDFVLKSEGFNNSRLWLQRNLRRVCQILQAPHVDGKAPSMLVQFPLPKDDELAQEIKVNRERNAVNTLASFIRNAQGEKPINES